MGEKRKMLSGFISVGQFKGDGAHSQTPFGGGGPRKEWKGLQGPREVTEGCLIHGSGFSLRG